jgi:hypothetical protein
MASQKKLVPGAGKMSNPRVPANASNPPDQRGPSDKDGNAEQARKPAGGSSAASENRKKPRAQRTAPRRAW